MFKDDDEEEDNTFGVTRYACMPSLVALQQMRNRHHLANLGRKLMKWTALATGTELRNIAGRLDTVYQSFSEDMRDAYIALARCRYFYPNLNKMVVEGCPSVAEVILATSTKTASGVKIIKYDVIENCTHPYEHLGIEKGGQTILDAKKTWLDLLKRIILMVELRTNFRLVESMHKAANKKWNVLSKMVVPRISLSTRYILSELEEIEREDNFRLKRFKELKTKKKEKDSLDTQDLIIKTDEFDGSSEEKKNLKITEENIPPYSNEDEESKLKFNTKIEADSQNFEQLHLDVKQGTKDESQLLLKITEKDHNKADVNTGGESSLRFKSEIKDDDHKLKQLLDLEVKDVDYKQHDYETRWDEKNIDEKCSCPTVCLPGKSTESLHSDIIRAVNVNDEANNYFLEIMSHADEIIKLSEQNTDICTSKVLAIQSELKAVLEKIFVDRVCDYCKKKIHVTKDKDGKKDSILENNVPKSSRAADELSIPDSMYSIKSADKEKLGLYERKYKEVIKVLRVQNDDGTISEKKKKVTVQTNKRNLIKAKSVEENNSEHSYCPCFESDSESGESIKRNCTGHQEFHQHNIDKLPISNKFTNENNLPSSTKSEPTCRRSKWNEAKPRHCISAEAIKQAAKLDAGTCCCPGDITVNLRFRKESWDDLENINLNKLPLTSNIKVNFCNLQETSHVSNLRGDLCTTDEKISDYCLQKCYPYHVMSSSQNIIKENLLEPCTCDFGSKPEKALDESSHAINTEDAEVEASGQNVSNNIVDISYIFNNALNTNKNIVNNGAAENTCLQLRQFAYIFNNVKKLSNDIDNIDIFKVMDALFEEICNYVSIFPQKFSCYKRIEIESMVNDACLYDVNFPYIFSQCVSAGSVKEKTRFDAVTCCCLGDITVNFTFQGRSCDKLQSVHVAKSSVAPSVNVNFCTLPRNIFPESMHISRICDDLNGTSKHEPSTRIVPNREVTGICKCDLDSIKEQTVETSSQAFSEVGDKLKATTENVSTNITDMTYIFNNVVNANENYERNDAIENTCILAPEFEYIFSKVKKIDDTENDADDSSKTINNFFKECCNYTSMFSYIFSSYKRIEIESMFKSACSQVISFPYIFTNLKDETQISLRNNLKKDIHFMFIDACKRSFDFTYIFSHIKNAQIDDLIKRSCTHKFDFPYIFSNIRNEKQILQNNGTSRKVEIEEMFKSACKRITEFAYISNHLNSVKIDNMIKKACMHVPEFPYVFSKTEDNICCLHYSESDRDRLNQIAIDQMFKDSCIRSYNFDYIFYPTKSCEPSNISLENKCRNAKYNSYNCSYIFSKVSELSRSKISNHFIDFDNILINDNSGTKEFNCDCYKVKVEKSTQWTERENELRLTEIPEIFMNTWKPISKVKCNYSHIFQNIQEKSEGNNFAYIFSKVNSTCVLKSEFLYNKHQDQRIKQATIELEKKQSENYDILKNISDNNYAAPNMTYIFSKVLKSAAPIGPSNDLDIDITFKDSCLHKPDLPYVFNKLEFTETTEYCNLSDCLQYQEIEKLFKDSCKRNSKTNCTFKYIFEKVDLENKKEFVYIFSKIKKSDQCLIGINSFDDIKDVCKEKKLRDFEVSQNIVSPLTQDCYTTDENWYQNQRFENNKRSIKECEYLNKNINNCSYIFSKVLNSSQPICPVNFIEIDVMFNDACKSKNDFPYIFDKIAQFPKREEIEKLFKDSCKIDVNYKHKYGYLFKKCSECNSQSNKFNCKCTKKSSQLLRCSRCTGLINKKNSIIKNANETSHQILVRLPSSKGGSSCLGVEVAWRTDYVCDNNLLSRNQSTTVKSLTSSRSCCDVVIKNINDKGILKSRSLFNQENLPLHGACGAENTKLTKDQANISLIRHMLHTIKNVYVPFSKSVTAERSNERSSEIDNLNSLLSNSTTSTYSWKSCVMKTCQAEMETEEKNISYSGLSLGSSLDYVSYKSEGTGSIGEKRILFDIEMEPGHIFYNTGSCLSTNMKYSSKVILKTQSNISDKGTCSSNMVNKQNLCENLSNLLDARKNISILKQNNPNQFCSRNHQFSKPIIGASSCSSISVYKHVCPLNLECCCYICKQHNNYENVTTQCCQDRAPCFSNRNARSVKKSLSFDQNKCCCNKKHH